MKLWHRIRNVFGGTPALRNKPGGMAFINAKVNEGEGSIALVNRVVRTVRSYDGDFWEIDPPQAFTITKHARNAKSGLSMKPGDVVRSIGIRDEYLTPIKGDGVTDEEVRELFSPRQPVEA